MQKLRLDYSKLQHRNQITKSLDSAQKFIEIISRDCCTSKRELETWSVLILGMDWDHSKLAPQKLNLTLLKSPNQLTVSKQFLLILISYRGILKFSHYCHYNQLSNSLQKQRDFCWTVN